jgi:hypothetical protein
LIRAQATHVAGQRVQCLTQEILDAERPQDSDQVLDADPAIGCLDPPNYSSRDIGALG